MELISNTPSQVFLGQKYGYRPIPTYILSSELQMLRDDLANTGTDPGLLDLWYRKDSNAVPPVSVLQPISSILVNFNNKVTDTHTHTHVAILRPTERLC